MQPVRLTFFLRRVLRRSSSSSSSFFASFSVSSCLKDLLPFTAGPAAAALLPSYCRASNAVIAQALYAKDQRRAKASSSPMIDKQMRWVLTGLFHRSWS